MSDETEANIAALELILVEVLSDLPPGRLQLAMERIRSVGQGGAFEVAVRRQAVSVLDSALRRHDMFSDGAMIPKA